MGGLSSNTGLYKTKGFYLNNGTYAIPMNETNLTGLGLSSSNIDARLEYLATLGLTDITIYLFGNDARTSASDEAVGTLTDAGCYIESDYTP